MASEMPASDKDQAGSLQRPARNHRDHDRHETEPGQSDKIGQTGVDRHDPPNKRATHPAQLMTLSRNRHEFYAFRKSGAGTAGALPLRACLGPALDMSRRRVRAARQDGAEMASKKRQLNGGRSLMPMRASISMPAMRMVEKIKPLVRGDAPARRRRPKSAASAACSISRRRASGSDPGRRERRRRLQAHARHRERHSRIRSASISSPCASTISSCKAPSRSSSSIIMRPASSSPMSARRSSRGSRRAVSRPAAR